MLLQPVSSLRFQLCRRCACSRYSVYWATRHYAVHRYRQTSKCSVLTRYLLSTNYSRNTPWQYGKRHPHLQGSECFFPLPIFSFSSCLPSGGFFIEPATEIRLLCLCPLLFCTSTFVRSRSAFIRYILSGAKLVTAYLGLKGRAQFRRDTKKSSFFCCSQNEYFSRKPCKLSVGTLVKHRKGYIKR